MMDKKPRKRKLPRSPEIPKQHVQEKKAKPESKFTEIKFRFLLRSPETVATALQTFLECAVDDADSSSDCATHGLLLLESYCKNSPLCSEVLDLLDRQQKTSHEVSLIFSWLRFALRECREVVASYTALRQHIVSVLLTKHMHTITNSFRQGNKSSHAKSTLLLLAEIVQLGYKYAKLIHSHFDFTHHNLPHLLTQRDRKDPCDVRASLTIFLMRLLLVEEAEITKTLVEQKVLLQEVFKGLIYDKSHYVTFVLNTVHTTIVKNESVGKTAKIYLFNSPVLKELLALYHWYGPRVWKRQPTDEEKWEYTDEQKQVAAVLHPFLVDLCANSKLGLCFRDKNLGMSSENKNPAISKVLQALLTSYTTPMSHKLVAAILKTCPDQMHSFLKSLQPHLLPRPIDTWLACIQFFVQVYECHEWPSPSAAEPENLTEEQESNLLRFLFPPDGLISTIKDGLKHACATVRHRCLQALVAVVTRVQHFLELCKEKYTDQSPVTLAIEGHILKTIPNPQQLVNLLNKLSSKEGFDAGITRELFKDSDVQLPVVSRFEHLLTILKMFSLTPDHLTSSPETVSLLLSLTTDLCTSQLDIDCAPTGVSANLPSLCLLHALSRCDAKKLPLFGKAAGKGDAQNGLLYQLVCLMQIQHDDAASGDTAQHMIVKLLMTTGLFEGHKGELCIWLRHLETAESAPSEAISYFVNVLRQYISNPYPAIDHLLELVEESPQLIDGCYLPYVRLEFSPMTMLALKSDFHSSEKVHQYLSCVLVDILHSLQDPVGFSKLVHSLSQHLDPAIVSYITFHTPDETFSLDGISQRMCSKSRLKQVAKCKIAHRGLALFKSCMKDGTEDTTIENGVVGLSPSGCLCLMQQCLRYLDEIVVGRKDWEAAVKYKKMARVCHGTIKAVFQHLHGIRGPATTSNHSGCAATSASVSTIKATKSMHAGVAGDEKEDIEDEEESRSVSGENVSLEETPSRYCAALHSDLGFYPSTMSSVPHLTVSWFLDALLCLLRHRLTVRWLFSEGFSQQNGDAQQFCVQFCTTILEVLHLWSGCHKSDTLSKIFLDYQHQICSILKDPSKIPSSLHRMLGRCVEMFFTKTGQVDRIRAILALFRFPLNCFIKKEAGQNVAAELGETILRLTAETEVEKDALSELLDGEDFTLNDFRPLFDLLVVLEDPELVSFVLQCVQASPEIALACSEETWTAMLNRFGNMSAAQQELVECLMMFSPVCHKLCGEWVSENKSMLLQTKQTKAAAPLTLMYVQLLQRIGGDLTRDAAVKDVSGVVCQRPVQDLDEIQLQIISYFIHWGILAPAKMRKIGEDILCLMQQEVHLHAGHVQLLAAILRHQMLLSDEQICWGEVLEAILRYMCNKALAAQEEDVGGGGIAACIVELCHALLAKPLTSLRIKTLGQLWPEVVTSCLKFHYKDHNVLSLLRRMVCEIFVEDSDELTEEKADSTIKEEEDGLKEDSENEDTELPEDQDENDTTHNPKKSEAQKREETPVMSAYLPYLSAESFRKTVMVNKSEIAEKFASSSFSGLDRDLPELYPSADVEKKVLKNFFPQGRYFIRPSRTDDGTKQLRLASSDFSALVKDLCQKCVCHSEFLDVMQGGELQQVKEELVHLLATLVQLEKECCTLMPQKVLLAAYGASLSLTDQRLLFMMMKCEEHRGKGFSPGLWGEASVEQMEVQQHLGKSLMREPQLKEILDHIDPVKMEKSVLCFPLLRTMYADDMGKTTCVVPASKMLSKEDCYDPRFFLQLFNKFLGPEHFVDVRVFIQTNCLSLALAALSSHDALMRSFAYQSLADFFSHVEGAPHLPEKAQLLAFRDLIKESITKENQKLAYIITLFLARAICVISDPGHVMFLPVASFLLLKPALDVKNVPELYHFFNSPKPQERGWLYQLMKDGLRETGDHRIFERRFVYKLLMCHCSSSLADPHSKREIVKILLKASSMPTVVRDLVTEHGLPAWLVSYVKDSLSDRTEDVRPVCQLLHQLWHTTSFNSTKLWWYTLPHLARDCLLLSPLRVCIHSILSNFSSLDIQSFMWLLEILHNPEYPTVSTNRTFCPGLVTMALFHLGRLCSDPAASAASKMLSENFGFKLPSYSRDARQRASKAANEANSVDEKSNRLRHLIICLLLEWDVDFLTEDLLQITEDRSGAYQAWGHKVEAILHAAVWALHVLCYPEMSGKLLEVVCWVDKVMSLAFPPGGHHGVTFSNCVLRSVCQGFLLGYRASAWTLKAQNTSDILFTNKNYFPGVVETCKQSLCTERFNKTGSFSQRTTKRASSFSAILSCLEQREGITWQKAAKGSQSFVHSPKDKKSEPHAEEPEENVTAHQSLLVSVNTMDPNHSVRCHCLQFCCVGQPSWYSLQSSLGCLPFLASTACLNTSMLRILAIISKSAGMNLNPTVLEALRSCSSQADGASQEMLAALVRELILKGSTQANSLTMLKMCDFSREQLPLVTVSLSPRKAKTGKKVKTEQKKRSKVS